jgi:predicted Zn-ribbon and HTH transcriptional regulator
MSTIRKDIIDMLREGEWAAWDISKARHLPEKEVYDHLGHIRRLLRGEFSAACGMLSMRIPIQ